MTTAFPAALDAYGDPAAGGVQGLTTPTHSAHHKNHNDAVEALEAKLGIGASTAAVNTVLRGTGAGQTAFGLVASDDIVAGAATASWSKTATTSGPSASGGGGLISECDVPIVSTGGAILFLFEIIWSHPTPGTAIFFDLYLAPSTLMARRVVNVLAASANHHTGLMHWGALSPGSYTIEARWSVSAGTVTGYDTNRRLTVVELRK